MKVLIARSAKGAPVERIIDLCRASKVPYTIVDPRVLDSMTDGGSHQGVAASVSPVGLMDFSEALCLMPGSPEAAMAAIADHVEDPRNLGAMIRSAEASGAVFVALPLRRGALPTGTVAKTSAGASLRLPLASVINVGNAVREAKEAGFWVIGLDAEAGTDIYSSPLPARCVFVVGGEGRGMSRTALKACDEVMSIPMRGVAGSLNASVALSVCMFEWLRLHGKSNIRSGEDEFIKGEKK
jgi:23S rRNA (guanosine2251-2'-O)-methyltransferase